MRRTENIFLICLFLCINGCVRDSPIQIMSFQKPIKKVDIFCDVFVTHDVKGSIDIVNLPFNIDRSKIILKQVSNKLFSKGYQILKENVFSVGLLYKGTSTAVRVIKTKKDKVSVENHPIENPPLFINNKLKYDERKHLDQVVNNLRVYLGNPGRALNKNIPSSSLLKKTSESDSFLILFVLGREVSTSKSIGQGILTGILTLGMVSVYQVPFTRITGFLIDAESEKIIWVGNQYREVSIRSERGTEKVIDKFFRALPDSI